MSRLVCSALFGVCMFVVSITAVGCGSDNAVIEDTRSPDEIQQEMDAYDKELSETPETTR